MVLFHVKESAAMGFFDGVRNVAGRIYSAEKEFRTIVFLIFHVSC